MCTPICLSFQNHFAYFFFTLLNLAQKFSQNCLSVWSDCAVTSNKFLGQTIMSQKIILNWWTVNLIKRESYNLLLQAIDKADRQSHSESYGDNYIPWPWETKHQVDYRDFSSVQFPFSQRFYKNVEGFWHGRR